MAISLTLAQQIMCETGPCPDNIFMQQYPQFQIISAAKTGSTSLYSYLCQHPDNENLAKKKETNILRSANMMIRNEKVNIFWK